MAAGGWCRKLVGPRHQATSTAPAGWVRGGGTGALAQASLDVQAKLRAEAEALKRCNEVFLESQAAIHVSFLCFSLF